MSSGIKGNSRRIWATVKWFDSRRGFGFLWDPVTRQDVLLHKNVLRNFGRSGVVIGAEIDATICEGDRGLSVVEIHEIATDGDPLGGSLELDFIVPGGLDDLEHVPAKVRWYDSHRGFGFARAFGSPDDILLRADIIKAGGFQELEHGEAISVKCMRGQRGWIAVVVAPWR